LPDRPSQPLWRPTNTRVGRRPPILSDPPEVDGSEGFLFPLSRAVGGPPSVCGGVLARACEQFRPPRSRSALGLRDRLSRRARQVRDFRPQVPGSSGGPTLLVSRTTPAAVAVDATLLPGAACGGAALSRQVVACMQEPTLLAALAGGRASRAVTSTARARRSSRAAGRDV